MDSKLHRAALNVAKEDVFLDGVFLEEFLCAVLYHETRLIVFEALGRSKRNQRILFDYHLKGDCYLRHVEAVKYNSREATNLTHYGFVAVFEYGEENLERWYAFDMKKLGFLRIAEFEPRDSIFIGGRMGKMKVICGYSEDEEKHLILTLYVLTLTLQKSFQWFSFSDNGTKFQLITRQICEHTVSTMDAVWIKNGILVLATGKNDISLVGYYLDLNKVIHKVNFETQASSKVKFDDTFLCLNDQIAFLCGIGPSQSICSVYQWGKEKYLMKQTRQFEINGNVTLLCCPLFKCIYLTHLKDSYQLGKIDLQPEDGNQQIVEECHLNNDLSNRVLCDLSLDVHGSLRLLTTKELIWLRSDMKAVLNSFESYELWVFDQEFPYSRRTIQDILEKRRTLGGHLFFDRLLRALSIPVSYPVADSSEHRLLYERILKSEIDYARISCLLYYLVLDMSPNLAIAKAQNYGLSLGLQHLMNTYWFLDHHEFEYAYNEIIKFAPCLDWKSDVIRAFYLHGYTDYALRLFQMLRIGSETPGDMVFYSDILLDIGNIQDLFEFYRTYASFDTSHQLFHNILWKCFARHNPSYIQTLMELPFTHREAGLIRDFCMNSQEYSARDFIILYQVHRGQYSKATDLYRLLNRKSNKREPCPFLDLIMNILWKMLSAFHPPNPATNPKVHPETLINYLESSSASDLSAGRNDTFIEPCLKGNVIDKDSCSKISHHRVSPEDSRSSRNPENRDISSISHVHDTCSDSGRSNDSISSDSSDRLVTTILEISSDTGLERATSNSSKNTYDFVDITTHHGNSPQKSTLPNEIPQTSTSDEPNSKPMLATFVPSTASDSTYPYYHQIRGSSITSKSVDLEIQRPRETTKKKSGAMKKNSVKSPIPRPAQPSSRRVTRSMLKDAT